MSAGSDVFRIQRWLLNLSTPNYFALITFTLVAWMAALTLALEFPTRVGSSLLWALDAVVVAVAWTAHTYFAVARPQTSQVSVPARSSGHEERTTRKPGQRADTSPVALAVCPLAICASLAWLLVTLWPDPLPPIGWLPVLAIPAGLVAAWVIRYTRPGT